MKKIRIRSGLPNGCSVSSVQTLVQCPVVQRSCHSQETDREHCKTRPALQEKAHYRPFFNMDLEGLNEIIRNVAIPANYPVTNQVDIQLGLHRVALNRYAIATPLVPDRLAHLANIVRLIHSVKMTLEQGGPRWIGPSHVYVDQDDMTLYFIMYIQ